MNKKVTGEASGWRLVTVMFLFACCVSTAAFASSFTLQIPLTSEEISLQSKARISLTLQSASDPRSNFDLIESSDKIDIASVESNLGELLIDGVHPPEPAEPPQPIGKIFIKPQLKPRTVPALKPAATTTTTATTTKTRSKRTKATSALAITTTTPAWAAIGPTPIPNGQTAPANSAGISLSQSPVSGRTTAVAIDPADPNIAYIGTAQGGLYRTLDGGQNWTQLFDNAASLAIGVLELDPSDPTTLLIGSGESNFGGDSFAGVGVYKITDVKGANPMLSGPYNQDTATGSDISAHRSIPGLAIDPNNHDVVYIATSTGQQGIGPQPPTPGTAPNRGLYRSTNFFSGSSTFTKIPVLGASEPVPPDYRVTSIAYEPGSSDHMFVGVADTNTSTTSPPYFGGLYYTANASAANPTFTKVIAAQAGTFSPFKIAVRKIGDTVTVAAVSGEPKTSATVTGALYTASYSASAPPAAPTFTEKTAARGFAGGQGSYNLGVDIDPTNANNIYIVGTLASTTDASGTFKFTRDGGTSFSSSTNTLHVDSHMVGVAPSNPDVIYTGNDGGIWKTTTGTSSVTWSDLNRPTYSATQFQSVAVHPIDRNFGIGGTQDNGTEYFHSGGFWTRADFGDGGYAVIDQTATSVENTVMYHTYYNVTQKLVGFSRVLKAHCATEGQWALRGGAVAALLPDFITPIPVVQAPVCDGSVNQALNGLDVADSMNFYAPMTLGPAVVDSTGQTVYFGTDKLYRSIDQGDHMTVVSQLLRPPTPPATAAIPISSIAISPQDDNVRVVGTNDGHVFATTVGAPAMVDVTDATMPGKYIGRIVVDPNNKNIVYVGFNGNAIQGKHVWKGNLSGFPLVTWTALDGATLPDISVNAIAVDPLNSNHVYVGTDRGVYFYDTAAASPSWSAYGTGLPNVQVFDLAIQSSFRILRAATHGRGFYEVPTSFRVNAVKAVSRKFHAGAPFDIQLPISGTTAVTSGIECRSGGPSGSHQIIMSFGVPVNFASAAVTSGTGSVSNTSGNGTDTITVNLDNVANAQTIVVTLAGVADGTTTANVAVQMGVLAGDTTGNGTVNSSDVAQTQSQSGQLLDTTNFVNDVTVNGAINSSDVSFVQSRSGTALP
jgi:hypothetical protein